MKFHIKNVGNTKFVEELSPGTIFIFEGVSKRCLYMVTRCQEAGNFITAIIISVELESDAKYIGIEYRMGKKTLVYPMRFLTKFDIGYQS